MTRSTPHFAFAFILSLASAPVAHAQTAPATPLPGLDDFSLPAERPTPRPSPSAEPTTNPRPLASATPRPAVTATPRAQPTRVVPPKAGTTVRATPTPVVRPTPAARPVIRATPSPDATSTALVTPRPAPRETSQASSPVANPPVGPTTAPLPLPVVTPTQPAASQSAPSATSPGSWLGIGGLLLAALLAAAFVWWRKRSRREQSGQRNDRDHEIFLLDEAEEARPVQRQPEMLRRSPPPPPTPAPRAVLDLELIPNSAGTDSDGASVDYLLVVRNTGAAVASNIGVDVRLLGAGTQQDAVIAALFAQPVTQSVTPPFALDPGGAVELGGNAAHPRETLYAVEMGGRALFVPVLAVNLAYEWPGGSGQTAQSWVIGIARGAEAKLQPFRLDGPPRMYLNVSALEYPVAVAS